MSGRDRFLLNPLDLLAGKQLVGQKEADKNALLVLIALDAAKRGAAPGNAGQHAHGAPADQCSDLVAAG